MGKPKKLKKLMKAAKMGKPDAMYHLGLCYLEGWHCLPRDIYEAADWIRAAAQLDYGPALQWAEEEGFDDDALVQGCA